jgi:hypothetical protein
VQLHRWIAHNSAAIVSIACAENIGQDKAKYLITASTDLTAKLWSLDGTLIGTFGQVSRILKYVVSYYVYCRVNEWYWALAMVVSRWPW